MDHMPIMRRVEFLKSNLIISACDFICITFIFFSTLNKIFTCFRLALYLSFNGQIKSKSWDHKLKTSLRYSVSNAYICTSYFQFREHQIYAGPSTNHIQFEVRPIQGSPNHPKRQTVQMTYKLLNETDTDSMDGPEISVPWQNQEFQDGSIYKL